MKQNEYIAPNWAHTLPSRQQEKVQEWFHAGFNPHKYVSFEAMAQAVIDFIDEASDVWQEPIKLTGGLSHHTDDRFNN